MQVRAHLHHLVENAVNAETHHAARAGTFDVYVARAVAHRALYQAVDQINDRTCARDLIDGREVRVRLLDQRDIGRQVFGKVLRYFPAAERIELALCDFFAARQHPGQLEAGDPLNFVEGGDRIRIGDGQGQRIVD